jgi:hypothetical protein
LKRIKSIAFDCLRDDGNQRNPRILTIMTIAYPILACAHSENEQLVEHNRMKRIPMSNLKQCPA